MQTLVAQIIQLGVGIPEQQLLEAALQRVEGFQARAREALGARPSRSHLADLQQARFSWLGLAHPGAGGVEWWGGGHTFPDNRHSFGHW